MKAVSIILGTLIAIVVILVTLLLTNLNSIVKEAIITVGSNSLKTSVKVGAVDIKLTEGEGSVRGLSIANPKGFSQDTMMSVGSIGLALDIQSLSENVYVIKQLFIEEVMFSVEHQNLTETNIQALLANISDTKSGAAPHSTPTTEKREEVRLMIENLRVGESMIKLNSQKFGAQTLTLPGYTQTHIGDKTMGLTPSQLAETIATTMLTKVKQSVSEKIKQTAKDEVKKNLEEETKKKLEAELKNKIDVDQLKSFFK